MTDDLPRGRQPLGRGLSALFGEDQQDETAQGDGAGPPRQVAVDRLSPNPFQPRRTFDEGEIQSLAASIAQHGLLQPVIVRQAPNSPGSFQIVAGERRWRAAQMAKLHEIPVVIKELTDQESLEVAIVENIQRQDLNPVEEAEGYRRLLDEFAHRQEDLARIVGKSRSHVANTLRLLNLPPEVRRMLERGEITAGHARALLNSEQPVDLAKEVAKRGLTVRQTERRAQGVSKSSEPKGAVLFKDANIRALERDLSERLGLKVTMVPHGDGGQMVIHYTQLEQIDEVLRRLNRAYRF